MGRNAIWAACGLFLQYPEWPLENKMTSPPYCQYPVLIIHEWVDLTWTSITPSQEKPVDGSWLKDGWKGVPETPPPQPLSLATESAL